MTISKFQSSIFGAGVAVGLNATTSINPLVGALAGFGVYYVIERQNGRDAFSFAEGTSGNSPTANPALIGV